MMYVYNCTVVRVIDGDTVVVNIDLGFDCWHNSQHIRLAGIDAPEVRTRDLFEKEKGLASKQFVEQLLPVGSKQVLISRQYTAAGKYGRIIGDFQLYDPVQDRQTTLCEIMVRQGMAEVYGE